MAPNLAGEAPVEMLLGIRPEDVEVFPTEAPTAEATVVVREPMGSDLFLTLEVGGATFKARTHPDVRVDRGENVAVRFTPSKVHLFDRQTGEKLFEKTPGDPSSRNR